MARYALLTDEEIDSIIQNHEFWGHAFVSAILELRESRKIMARKSCRLDVLYLSTED